MLLSQLFGFLRCDTNIWQLYSLSKRSFEISMKHYTICCESQFQRCTAGCLSVSSPCAMSGTWRQKKTTTAGRRSGLGRQFDGPRLPNAAPLKSPLVFSPPVMRLLAWKDTDVVFRVLYERALLLTSSKPEYILWSETKRSLQFATSGPSP